MLRYEHGSVTSIEWLLPALLENYERPPNVDQPTKQRTEGVVGKLQFQKCTTIISSDFNIF